MHRLVVLGSLGEFVELVKMAKERGYYTIVCDGYDFGPAKKYADKAYTIDIRDTDAVARMCKEENADGIIGSFSDLLFEKITEIAAKAGLRWYATPDMLPYYRMKNVAKQAFDRLGIKSAKSCTLKKDFADGELADFRFPLVIKPVNGYGSKGIYVVNSIQEIRDRFDDVLIRSSGIFDEIAVEEYLHGKEYNMMTWLVDGRVNVISIADREKNPQEEDRIPLCNRIVYPAEDVAGVIEKASEVLRRFAEFTGQKEGALSMQFFCLDGEIYVCEIAGRLFGYEHELVTYGSGFSIEKLLLDYVYDEPALRAELEKHSPYYPHCCAVIYITGKHGMKIGSQQGLVKLQEDPHVLESILFYNEGETVDNYGPNPYFARYYVDADSREELDRVTERFFRDAHVEDVNGMEVTYQLFLNKEGN